MLAISTLTIAVGLALAMQAPIVYALGMANPLQMVKDTIERMRENKLERCYGINAAAKNHPRKALIPMPARRPRCNPAKAGIALRLSIAKLRHSSGGGLDRDSYREPQGSGIAAALPRPSGVTLRYR